LGQNLRVMSANLMNGGADPDTLARLVESLAVDVLAVQEVSHEQAEALSRLFDYGEIDPDHNYVGMGLLSHYPVTVERIPFTWGFGQTARMLRKDFVSLCEPLEITNLHVAAPHMVAPAPGPYLRWRQAGEFKRYLRASDAREADRVLEQGDQPVLSPNCSTINSSSAMDVNTGEGSPLCPGEDLREGKAAPTNLADPKRLKKDAVPGPARVLVGDFNATPYWPWYWRMDSQFTDAAVTVANMSGESPKPTWGPWPGSPRVLRIDHGFLRRVDAEGFEVVDVAGSDHCALVMDLVLPV
jgi:hypothetical protein